MGTKIIPYIDGDYFNGIFKYFQNLTNENDLSKTNVVEFSSLDATSNYSKLFIDNDYWHSTKGLDDYLLIDFKKNKFMLDHYSYNAVHYDFPRKFSMYGSNNRNKWTQLDEHSTNYENEDRIGETLTFETQVKRRFRYLKLQMKEKRALGDNTLVIFKLELFGVFYSYHDLLLEEVSCKLKSHKSYICYSILFIISLSAY